LAKESLKRCRNGQLVLIDEATHWLHHEYPMIVNQWLFRYLKKEK
jgi:pimeloyl-ACP methyl ester carboxylesterase